MEPEQRLFRAVISQAVLDASEPPPRVKSFEAWLEQRRAAVARKRLDPESENHERAKYDEYLSAQNWLVMAHEHNRRLARTWLVTPSEDLREVLRLADIDTGFYWRKMRIFAEAGFRMPDFAAGFCA